jgi:hypothetical protein
MIEMLQYGFMQRAFITGILLAVIAPLIGITIVLKRMSMIGDALSHASLAGVIRNQSDLRSNGDLPVCSPGSRSDPKKDSKIF